MRRVLAALALAAGVAGAVVWWRRRSRAGTVPPVQLGLADGSTATLRAGEPAADGLLAAAAEVRRAFRIDA